VLWTLLVTLGKSCFLSHFFLSLTLSLSFFLFLSILYSLGMGCFGLTENHTFDTEGVDTIGGIVCSIASPLLLMAFLLGWK
jgi:hypothetical protein